MFTKWYTIKDESKPTEVVCPPYLHSHREGHLYELIEGLLVMTEMNILDSGSGAVVHLGSN